MQSTDRFQFSVHVPAEEWHYCRRRAAYLETLLMRIVRDRADIREWFSADDLAAQHLPGLPATAAAITRRARQARWEHRPSAQTRGVVYHVSSLPARAFDALVARIIQAPPLDVGVIEPLPEPPASLARPAPAMTAPAWVLPLMRLIRGEAQGDISLAWSALPQELPRGVMLPSVEEAAAVLIDLGLIDRMAL